MPLFCVLRGDFIYPIAVFLSIKISLQAFDFQGAAGKHAFGAVKSEKTIGTGRGNLKR